ncbi:hypothetical protein NDN08_006032 [Rhodosorus marinus]|uniref:COP9 signalosome complex subunit 4 n=1 Tax=Rhodosorus marinus TaxID=101924 RepID=A0AAV8UNE1_9RHOD|nr:hypothetical protein NDN08_006032 [Rhodosorus marinus]
MEHRVEMMVQEPDLMVREENLRRTLVESAQSGDLEGFLVVVGRVVSDVNMVPPVVAKRLVSVVQTAVMWMEKDTQLTIGQEVLNILQQRGANFEVQANAIRERLAVIHEERQNWSQAAAFYSTISPELGNRGDPTEDDIDRLLRIAFLYLNSDDVDGAEQFLMRAKSYVKVEVNRDYRICQARVQEAKKAFSNAAQQFYSLTTDVQGPTKLYSADPLQWLARAVICAILGKFAMRKLGRILQSRSLDDELNRHIFPHLYRRSYFSAPAGEQRSKMLSKLYQDERCRGLEFFKVLERVHSQKLLKKEHIEVLSERVKLLDIKSEETQQVLDLATTEHNLLAVSVLYTSIKLQSLAELLNISPQTAEAAVADMICERRLAGKINQVEGLLELSKGREKEALHRGDVRFEKICQAADSCCEQLVSKYPQFMPS